MFRPEVTDEAPAISVVGESFCYPYLVDLTVKKKIAGLSDARLEVLDDAGNLLLQSDGSIWNLRTKRVIRNPSGSPIVTMRRKLFKLREEWTVHRGESSDGSDLLYRVQRSQVMQLKTKLDVFLASNVTKNMSDFSITGSYLSESFKVHKGDNLIAEVKEKFKAGCLIGKQNFEVRVYAGVDYAFIVSLLVILNEIVSGG